MRNKTPLLALCLLSCLMPPALADEGETEPLAPRSTEKAPPAEPVSDANTAADESDTQAVSKEQATATADSPPPHQPFRMLDAEVPPGDTRRLSWVASESFAGISVPTPVLVSHGKQPGPTLCLTAAVHGDELNGIEMVRRVLYGLDPDKLSGTVVGVPIVNLFGFQRSSRYLPDRRDLNRYFPGDPEGSSASRIAHAFFQSVILNCDALVDLHTGSFHRTNLPQLRADLDEPAVLELTKGFGATAVLQSMGQEGTLRRAATDAGVPAVTLEAGEPMRFQPDEVAHGVKGIRSLLNHMGMLSRVRLWGEPQPVYYESDWIRAATGGILFSKVALGEQIEKDQLLGTVTDPITNNRSEIRAPQTGRILGMALNQVVIPGFAVYRIGIEKSSEEISSESEAAEGEAAQAAAEDGTETVSAKKQAKSDAKEVQERPD